MNNKKIYLILGIVSLVVLILSGTYAWIEWQSSTNTNVTFEVGDLGITYIGDENILSKVLYPTIYMNNKDNIIHNFSLTTSSNIDIYTKISLDIINIDEELKDISFVWKLYKGNNLISGGNFASASAGSDVLLIQNEKITNTLNTYTLYIWIDGTVDNPVDMGGKSFNFKLKFSAGQIDYVTDEECFSFNESTNTITDYLCDITDVVIPSYINGVVVKSIANSSFKSKNLTSLMITDSVTKISSSAFASNNIISLRIGSGVIDIGRGVCAYSPTLSSIIVDEGNTTYDSRDNSNAIIETYSNTLKTGCKNTIIPSSVTKIDTNAFEGMGLTEIEIPSSVKEIGNGALSFNALTEVTIPNSVVTIGGDTFRGNNLTSLVIPSSVTSIGSRAFVNNTTLTSIVVDEGNTTYDSRDNSNAIIETLSNKLIQGCKNTIIPSTVTSIADYAFYGMDLTEVVIPSSVETIGKSAFLSDGTYNTSLTTIYNNTGRAFDFTYIIKGWSGSTFVTGTITTTDGRVITITTSDI